MDYRKETQLHRSQSRRQKISLPVGSKAEDTLKVLCLDVDTSGCIWLSDSASSWCAESPTDGSGSEDSVVSGPSSPSAALRSLRCRNCERLFSKMRTQGPLRKKQRDDDPASLSCDEWRLNKTWQPQRWQQSRGRLWVHLKRIRLRAAQPSDDAEADKTWSRCSRPHVFLQRNVRRCKSKSKSKSKPARTRAKPVQPLRSAAHERRKKRKSSENTETSEHLSPPVTTEDGPPSSDSSYHEGLQRSEKVPRKQSASAASGFLDIRSDCSGLEGTRRVLKFDTSPDAALKSAGRKSHTSRAGFTAKSRDRPAGEDPDVFRTPVDHSDADPKVVRKSRPSCPSGSRKDSFRSMLAAVARGHNRIIKESHH